VETNVTNPDPSAILPTDAPAPTALAEQSAPSPVLTPDIQALIAVEVRKAHDAGAAATRRTSEQKSRAPVATQHAHPEQAPVETITRTPSEDFQALMQRQRSFDRTAGKFALSESAMSILESDFASARPDDVAGWVTTRAEAFGWRPLGSPVNPTPVTPVAGTAPVLARPGAYVTANGAPADPTRVLTPDVPIYEMSAADQAALTKAIGPVKYAERMMREFRERGTRVRLK